MALDINPADVSQLVTATITVADNDANGAKSSPLGTVGLSSSVVGDTIAGSPCTLTAVPLTTTSSCQITVTANTAEIAAFELIRALEMVEEDFGG